MVGGEELPSLLQAPVQVIRGQGAALGEIHPNHDGRGAHIVDELSGAFYHEC